jgi:hypothetical protein
VGKTKTGMPQLKRVPPSPHINQNVTRQELRVVTLIRTEVCSQHCIIDTRFRSDESKCTLNTTRDNRDVNRFVLRLFVKKVDNSMKVKPSIEDNTSRLPQSLWPYKAKGKKPFSE